MGKCLAGQLPGSARAAFSELERDFPFLRQKESGLRLEVEMERRMERADPTAPPRHTEKERTDIYRPIRIWKLRIQRWGETVLGTVGFSQI